MSESKEPISSSHDKTINQTASSHDKTGNQAAIGKDNIQNINTLISSESSSINKSKIEDIALFDLIDELGFDDETEKKVACSIRRWYERDDDIKSLVHAIISRERKNKFHLICKRFLASLLLIPYTYTFTICFLVLINICTIPTKIIYFISPFNIHYLTIEENRNIIIKLNYQKDYMQEEIVAKNKTIISDINKFIYKSKKIFVVNDFPKTKARFIVFSIFISFYFWLTKELTCFGFHDKKNDKIYKLYYYLAECISTKI